MRGALSAALSALGIVLACAALGQTFPDVKENHWAYEAITKLAQDGLLKGYPNGRFEGKRPLSRYEFAIVINAAYTKLKALDEPRSATLADLKAKLDAIQLPTKPTEEVTKADKDDLQTKLNALKTDLSGVAAYKTDIESLKRLTSEFQKELTSLGVDSKAVKQDLKSLTDRVTELENTMPKWWLNGDLNAIGIGRHGTDNTTGVDWTGNPEGPGGLTKDPQFAEELGLQIGTVAGRDVHVNSDVTIGNLLDYEFHSYSQPFPGLDKTAGKTSVFINRLSADWKAECLGNPMTVEMGRIGNKIGPYVLQRPDPDPYIDIPRYDNGEWALDGGKVKMDFNSLNFNVFAGKQSGRGDTNFVNDYPMTVGTNHVIFDQVRRPAGLNTTDDQLKVDTELGANMAMAFGRSSKFDLGYTFLDGQRTTLLGGLANPGFSFDRVGILGGGLKMGLADSVSIDANYAQSQLFDNGNSKLNSDNWAYDVGLNFRQGRDFNFGFGYREIRPFFSTPGDWGRIGFWYNPTDIKGLTLGGHYQFNPGMDFTARGEFYQGTGRAKNTLGNVVGLGTDDHVNRLQLGVGYKFTPRWKVSLGWEGVYWDLQSRANGFSDPNLPPFLGGKPSENYYSLGFNYLLGEKTTWRLMYQMTDYDGRDLSGFNAPGSSDTRAKGGILVTQFSIQF